MSEKITQSDESEEMEETVPKKKILKGHLPDPPREKKERTPAQIAAFERARASREANIKKKNEDAKRLAEYDAMMLKQKLVEKANKIKLKTMKKIEVIESISSEEDEVVIEKPKAKPKPELKPEPPLSKGVPKEGQRGVPAPPKKVIPYKFV
jgi:hypothetical protein